MDNKIGKLLELVQKLPESSLDDAIEYIEKQIGESAGAEEEPPCPHCGSSAKRNGHKNGVQRYLCNGVCGKSFGRTTNTSMSYSHQGEAVWKQVIRDTIDGKSLDDTADSLLLSHSTVFNMRHKILLTIEAEERRFPTVLDSVCELDDTYVLENFKGKKLPDGYWRKPRKHGAKAQKRGVSNEYISISTGIQRDGGAYCNTVTRSTPGKEDIREAFDGHIGNSALVLCDGAKSFNVISETCGCDVVSINDDNASGFYHINTANGLHSFIKERYDQYRGVATKYLNRYKVLFAKLYRSGKDLTNSIYNILYSNDVPRFHTVNDVKTARLLDI
jgi:transposase-like protein